MTRLLYRLWPSLECWMHDHDGIVERAPRAVFLRCTQCGRRTEGWTLDRPAPVPCAPEPRRRTNVLPMRRVR